MALLNLERNMTRLWSAAPAAGEAADLKSTPPVRLYQDRDAKGVWLRVTGTSPRCTLAVEAAPTDLDADFIQIGAVLITVTAAGLFYAPVPVIGAPLIRFRLRATAGNGNDTLVSGELYLPIPD